jgi:hypothetical protein
VFSFQFRISDVLQFMFICDLFTDSPSYVTLNFLVTNELHGLNLEGLRRTVKESVSVIGVLYDIRT